MDKKQKACLLSRLALPLAPAWAARHELARRAAGRLLERGSYTAADRGWRSNGWAAAGGTGEQVNQGAREIVRARSRDLERNSDMLTAEILALERNVIGTGMVLQARVTGADGGEDDTLNETIEELWREWCLPGNCEITGRLGFAEIGAMVVRRRFVDGGILIVKVYDDKQFKLQLLEVDDLDASIIVHGENRVIGGIELDEYRRAVAYHIKISDSWGAWVKTVRVAADRVIYLPFLTRPSQIREFAPAAPSLARIDDANELVDAAVEKERVLAHFSAAVETEGSAIGGLVGMGRGGMSDGCVADTSPPGELLEQGTIIYLKPGEKISPIAPAGTSSTVDPVIRTTQRMAGSAAGLSYEAVSRDMSQVNYSSARQGLLEDQRTYRMMQKYLIEHFFTPVYREWLDWAVLTKQLVIRGYATNPNLYRRHVWIPGGWDWIDPLKEVTANARALETDQTTLQEICASKGKDYRDVIRQRKIERELLGGMAEADRAPVQDAKKPVAQESAAAEVAAEGDSIQSVSLNGAQIDSLISIVQMVVTGQFPFDAALAILTAAFPFSEEEARKILNSGKEFEIEEGKNESEITETGESPAPTA